jgi:hypothetical protein
LACTRKTNQHVKYLGRKLIFFFIILIPFWSFLVWFFWPKTVFPGLIVDKTVFDRSGQEHRSINWILTHEKLVEPDGSQYDLKEDYYGFFPINRPEYVVRDLTIYNYQELDSLSQALDWLYYSDTYGIYRNEWVYGREINERSPLVYGGLTDEAYQLFRQMYKNRKLTITEFNTLASPTPLELRFKMERLLELDVTGWTGRYYHSLDTVVNTDIPRWMRRLHKRSYGRPFAYPDVPGIVLIHETNVIRVLRGDRHLAHPVPILNAPEATQERYGVPQYIRFPYWFDITFAKDSADIEATYKIHVTSRGDSLLDSLHLPNEFPAMISDAQEGLRYYFCGDWADNPVPFGLSYFAGSQYLRKFFYNNRSRLDRNKFFWEYYLPTITTIFEEYRKRKDTLEPTRALPPVHRSYTGYYQRYGIPYPNVGVGTSYRDYDPNIILGTEYLEAAYRDSVLQVQLQNAQKSGYYVGELGDTVFLDQQAPYDTLERILRRNNRLNADSNYVTDSARDFQINARLEGYLKDGPDSAVEPAVKTPSPEKDQQAEEQAREDSPEEPQSPISSRFFQRGARSGPAGQMSPDPAATPATPSESKSSPESSSRAAKEKNQTPQTSPEPEEELETAQKEENTSQAPAKEARSEPEPPPQAIKAKTDQAPQKTSTPSPASPRASREALEARFRVGARVAGGAKQERAGTAQKDSRKTAASQEEETSAAKSTGADLSSSPDDAAPAGDYPTNLELEDRYRIILGSFAKPSDADQLLNKIDSPEGMVVYIPKYDTYRVVYASYDDVRAADAPFSDVLKRYPQAWLVKF